MDIDFILRKLGGRVEAAKVCGVTPQAIYLWVKNNRLPVSEHTGATSYALALSIHAKNKGHNISPSDICPGAGQYMQSLTEDKAA